MNCVTCTCKAEQQISKEKSQMVSSNLVSWIMHLYHQEGKDFISSFFHKILADL